MGNGGSQQDNLSDTEAEVLQVVSSVSSSLSILGSLAVIFLFFWRGDTDFMNEMVVWLSVLDLLASFWFLLGPIPQDDPDFCITQGFFIQVFSLATVIFNACNGYNLYSFVCGKKNLAKLKRRRSLYLGVSFGIPLVTAFLLPLVEDGSFEMSYQSTLLWCWIPKYLVGWQMGIFYVFVALSIAINAVVFGLVSKELLDKSNTAEAMEASSHIVSKLNKYIAVFVFLWSWGCLNRLAGGVGYDPYWTAVMHAAFVPLQGFCNAILYSDVFELATTQLGCWTRAGDFRHRNLESRKSGTGDLQAPVLEVMADPVFEEKELFACTFNMGEGALPADMSKLLPRNADLYVVGLQECMCLEEMRVAMQKFCCEVEEYERYDAEIGATNKSLGYHGYIALTLLVKKRYVADGSFIVAANAASQVKRGVNLMVTRASNKGGVGLPCRFFDQRLAFVTCHLASDQHGKTRLGKRIEDARNLVSNKTGLVLNDDDSGFDFPITNYHTFVLGDLNYRMSHKGATPGAVLQMVAKCRQLESAGILEDPWQEIMEHDELHNSIKEGTSFSNFVEAPIMFAPSYQRHDGPQGTVTNDGDVDDLRQAFSLKNKKDGKERVPSYTDRILVHSLNSMKSRIICHEYFVNEDVDVSDHRPICAKYTLTINSAAPDVLFYKGDGPSASELQEHVRNASNLSGSDLSVYDDQACEPSKTHPKAQNGSFGGSGVKMSMSEYPRYKVKLLDVEVKWNEDSNRDGPEAEKRGRTSNGHFPPLLRSNASANSSVVHLAFPMPSEDIFSAQRKVAELASSLMTSARGGHFKRKETFAWRRGMEMQVKAHAPAISHLHVLFRMEEENRAGQAAISLKEASTRFADPSGVRFAEFEEILTDEGQRTGTVTGKIQVAPSRSTSSKMSPKRAPGASDPEGSSSASVV